MYRTKNGSRKGRIKPDKWRNLLKAAEDEHKELLQRLAALQEDQKTLLMKQAVLHQITEGLGVVSECINHCSTACDVMSQPESLQAPACASEVHSSTAAGSASQGRQQQKAVTEHKGSVTAFCQGRRVEAAQKLEFAIQQQLSLAAADCCGSTTTTSSSSIGSYLGEATYVSTKMVRLLFDPEHVEKVLSLSLDELTMQLRHLAGKCAMMLLHDFDNPAAWDKETMLANMQSSSKQQQQQGSSSTQSDSSGTASDGSAHGSGAEDPPQPSGPVESVFCALHPALEFSMLVLILIMWDDHRFSMLLSSNLETNERSYVMPLEHWRSVAHKLKLSDTQVAELRYMRQIAVDCTDRLMPKLREVVQQQRASVQVQCRELSEPLQEPSAHAAVMKESMAVQEESIAKQTLLLKHWRIFALQQGICTINCLSMRQLATFCATSYPALPQINCVLAVLPQPTTTQPVQQQPSPWHQPQAHLTPQPLQPQQACQPRQQLTAAEDGPNSV